MVDVEVHGLEKIRKGTLTTVAGVQAERRKADARMQEAEHIRKQLESFACLHKSTAETAEAEREAAERTGEAAAAAGKRYQRLLGWVEEMDEGGLVEGRLEERDEGVYVDVGRRGARAVSVVGSFRS